MRTWLSATSRTLTVRHASLGARGGVAVGRLESDPGLVGMLTDTLLLFSQINVIPSSYFTYPAIITSCQSRHIVGDQRADRSLYQPQQSQNTY